MAWTCFLRTYATLFLAMDRRVVRIDIVGILTSLAAVYFNILSEIADILRSVVLIICDLRMTHM